MKIKQLITHIDLQQYLTVDLNKLELLQLHRWYRVTPNLFIYRTNLKRYQCLDSEWKGTLINIEPKEYCESILRHINEPNYVVFNLESNCLVNHSSDQIITF